MARDPWIVRAGQWVTKRRGVLLAPLFGVAVVAARQAPRPGQELLQDLLGLVCLIGGTRLRLVAASYHESDFGGGPITAGPYAWIRHPLYLANFLLGLGIILLAGWWPLLLVYLAVFIPLHAVIMRAEEVHLVMLYEDRYVAYQRAVPAVVPWRRYGGPREGRRSTFKLERGSEYLKVVGYAAGILALWAVKRWRQADGVGWSPSPLPTAGWVLGLLVAALAVIYRPRTRWAWLRGFQTLLALASILTLAIHLPGVWPSPACAVASRR